MSLARRLRAAAGNSTPSTPGIALVGTYGQSSAGSSATSWTFTYGGSLTGGLANTPQEGDIVFISAGTSASSNAAFLNSSGFSTLTSLYANNTGSTADCTFTVFYKVMTSTPDTSIDITSTPAVFALFQAFVFRYVDTTTPLDVTATTTTTITNGSMPDPSSITPVTTGAAVVVMAGIAGAGSVSAITTTDLTSFSTDGTGFYEWACGIKQLGWTSGAVDPAVLTGGGSSTRATAAVTIALRPL